MKLFISFYRLSLFIIFNIKKIKFKNFDHKKIVFLDGTRFLEFQRVINLKKNEYEIIDTRLNHDSSRFYISHKIIFNFFKFFFSHKSYSVYESYICACIQNIKPKFVIDVNQYGFLLNLLKYFHSTEFVVINDIVKHKFKPDIDQAEDYILTLKKFLKKNNNIEYNNLTILFQTHRDVDLFNDIGITEGSGINFKVIGSFKADFAKEKLKNIKKKYDILLVSQMQRFHDNLFGKVKKASTNLMISFINNLDKKKIAILCRGFKNSDDAKYEIDYFKKKINHKVDFLTRDKKDFIFSYKCVMQSKILITVNSTLGWEALVFDVKPIFAYGGFIKYYKWSPKNQNEKKIWKWNLFKKNLKKKDRLIYSSLLRLNWKNYKKKNQKYLNYLMPMKNSIKSHIFLKNYFKGK